VEFLAINAECDLARLEEFDSFIKRNALAAGGKNA